MSKSSRRMSGHALRIGTYFLQPYAHTEKHVRELHKCGIDFVTCMINEPKMLDLFEKYGVGAFLRGVFPKWWGGDGDNAGKFAECNPIEIYEEALAKFTDKPCVWGIDVGDEPSALDFPHFGKVIDYVNRHFPQGRAYLNLYPNYASVAQNNDTETVNQLGTATYEEHIEQYCKNVGTDYICYDFYQYSANIPLAYENLRIVSEAARKTGREMWIVLQVNSDKKEQWISGNMLRHQAYTAMAFGVVNIIWACYTAGWWYNQVLDDKGEKTEQYDKLRKVNSEIHHFGEYYKDFRNVATHFVGFSEDDSDLSKIKQKPIEKLDTGVFFGLHGDESAKLIVGQMVPWGNDGRCALMISNAGDPYDKCNDVVSVVTFQCYRKVKLVTIDGEKELVPNENGIYSFELPMSKGAMLITD